jgi:drug/metabolite transporter (DMT)-like permease
VAESDVSAAARTSALGAAIAASTASIVFGASVVATRFVVAQTQPVSLAFLRYLIASVCLLPVLYQVWLARMPRRDVIGICMLGALFFGIFPWSFSASLTYLPSARVAVLIATTPLLTLIVSRIKGYEQLTAPKILGQVLAFAGLWIALHRSHDATATSSDTWRGIFLALLTAVCGSIFNVFSRPYLRAYPPLRVSALAMAAGAVFLAPIAASQGLFTSTPAFTVGGWMAVGFLGVFGGAFGFALWIWALQRSTPSSVAVFIGLNPVTATLLGALLLDEPITLLFVIGMACVLAGIILANWRPAAQVARF